MMDGCSEEGQPVKPETTVGDTASSGKKDPLSDHLGRIIEAVSAKPAKPADNSACLVCHNDFAEEELSLKHEEGGVGCTGCHGPSEDHGGDELNILFPDFLFGRLEIVAFCTNCHKEEEHPKDEVYDLFLKKWSGKYRPNGRMISNNSICTDCHGNHAILAPHQIQFPTE
ncbi:MAG: cytochrome c3 family protein [Planctomycetota bacterium]|nr:MAG: cytochrome c3 family protein [Planctomycetota bacterium]